MKPESQPAGPRAILAERVFDGRCWHERAAVLLEGSRIRGIAGWDEVPADYARETMPWGTILAPGFIDLQVNGGGGTLLNDVPTAEGMREIVKAHRRFGTTSCLPTLITDTSDKIAAAIDAARSIAGHEGVLGLHIEGPFINVARKGVHRPDLIAEAGPADLELLSGLAAVGRSMVTLAPECVPEGFIRTLAGKNIRVSVGHSEATAEQVSRATHDGLRGVTHLFNAMPGLSSRLPGIAGAALADDRLFAGLIVDGLHVDPVNVRAAFAAKGAERIALVSDAMPSVGSASPTFELMGRTITLKDGRLTTEDGTLAGAHLDMASAVRNAVRLAGIPLEDALQAAALTPATFLGIENERGRLAPGAYADMVALTVTVDVIATWVEGDEERYQ
jgi:N-acetylglucosamine-6-phosphate deacetylase